MESVEKYYRQIEGETDRQMSRVKRLIFRLSMGRLVLVVAVLALLYIFRSDTTIFAGTLLMGVVMFVVLLIRHDRLFKQKAYLKTKKGLATAEIEALHHNYSSFRGGSEYAESKHSFAIDLDLFGEKSIFRSVNRAFTSEGERRLAFMLRQPLTDGEMIKHRQRAIQELSQKMDLILHIRALAGVEDNSLGSNQSAEGGEPYPPLFRGVVWKVLSWGVPVLFAILIMMNVFFRLSVEIVFLAWMSMVFIGLFLSAKIKKAVPGDGCMFFPSFYIKVIKEIEQTTFMSIELQRLKQELLREEAASEAIERFEKYRHHLELSFTLPMVVLFNPLILWNVMSYRKVSLWMHQHREKLHHWKSIVAEFDALSSWAVYAFNHPDYIFPHVDDSTILSAHGLGHPLILPRKLVRNDAHIPSRGSFMVITGANMAGKSTYLRTVGINFVLACCGSVVNASKMTFSPCHLVTNLRVEDSLTDGESYFYAELKRLKMIIDRLKEGKPLLIMLDEILKGTNSHDKQQGSLALMRQLTSWGGSGMIATHDLELAVLAKEFPSQIKNFCFEADIKGDKLTFSYRKREGVAKNLNATFLMKQMGITEL